MKRFMHFLSILLLISLMISVVGCAADGNGKDTVADVSGGSENNNSPQAPIDDPADTPNDKDGEDEKENKDPSSEKPSESTRTDVEKLLQSKHTLRFDENGRFKVDRVGVYAIVYEATDFSGNVGREVLWVRALNQLQTKLAVSLDAEYNTQIEVGKTVDLPEYTSFPKLRLLPLCR